MDLFRVTNRDTASRLSVSNAPKFRSGQILQGNILKLFPNQKAEIQLGNKRMIAHLEVGLKVGGNYHFQVDSTGEFLKLKVIGEQSRGDQAQDLDRLLNQLGIKSSQVNIHFLKQLFQEQIPFNRTQMQQATQLLSTAKNKPEAMNVLMEMLARGLPMKSSIFESIMTANTTSFQEGIRSVLGQMNHSLSTLSSSPESQVNTQTGQTSGMQTELQLRQLLTSFVNRPESAEALLAKEILMQNSANQSSLFTILQSLGHLSPQVNFTEWEKAWNNYNEQVKITPNQSLNQSVQQKERAPHLSQASQVFQAIQASLSSVTQQSNTLGQAQMQQKIDQVPLPFSLNSGEIFADLKKFEENKLQIIEAARNWVNQWGRETQFLVATGAKMSDEDFSTMIKSIMRDFGSVLTHSQQTALQTMQNNPANLIDLQNVLKALSNEQQLSSITKLVTSQLESESFLKLSPKQQFLQHIHFTLNHVGLNYEQQLLTDRSSLLQHETLKGLLLEMISRPEMSQSTAQQNLVHLINGLQIQSVHETPTFLQANLQIPAERLGLINDMKLEFEGKKKENGQLNPDYCRVLFHLELGSLKETMIDMQIQNRSISIVIYNNTKLIEKLATPFKAKLAASLENMDYRLSQIQYRPIKEKEKVAPQYERKINAQDQQGVDFRI